MRNEDKARVSDAAVEAVVVAFGSDQSSFTVAGERIESKISDPLINVHHSSDVLEITLRWGIIQGVCQRDEVTPVILCLIRFLKIGIPVTVGIRAFIPEVAFLVGIFIVSDLIEVPIGVEWPVVTGVFASEALDLSVGTEHIGPAAGEVLSVNPQERCGCLGSLYPCGAEISAPEDLGMWVLRVKFHGRAAVPWIVTAKLHEKVVRRWVS